jgi:hypothetical protein
MFNTASNPKELIKIEGGTHNYEIHECYNKLYNVIDYILNKKTNRFILLLIYKSSR